MTTAQFEHINGPHDGVWMPVSVDEHGIPVEQYIFSDMTKTDLRRDPTSSSLVDTLTTLYERDTRITDDGDIRYVFMYRGQDILRQYQPPRAA